MKVVVVSILAAICVVYVSADDEAILKLWSYQFESPSMEDMAPLMKTSGTIPDMAEKLGETVLVDLIKKAGLDTTLSGTGPFTVFGPTNAAFHCLCKAFMHELMTNMTLLKDVLQYHVAPGNVLSTDLKDNMMITTLQGKPIRINVYKNGMVITASGRPVTLPDQKATNGILHEVGKVMLPPPGTMLFAMSKCPVFSSIFKAVSVAGLADTLNGPGPFTVFAPTNKAIAKLPTKCVDYLMGNKEVLTELLTYHVISGVVYSAGMTTGDQFQTMNGKSVTITIPTVPTAPNGKVLVNNIEVNYPDATVTNGVMHIIDTVLLPRMDICDSVPDQGSEFGEFPAWYDVLF